jgi:hypothetical protein
MPYKNAATPIPKTIPANLHSLSSREEKGIEFPIQNKLMDLLNGLQVQYSGEI